MNSSLQATGRRASVAGVGGGMPAAAPWGPVGTGNGING